MRIQPEVPFRKRSFVYMMVAVLLLAACTVPPVDVTQTSQPVSVTEPVSAPTTNVPLKDALGSLEPQDVFQNFYDITQIPRPSGQMDQIREFLVNFGERIGLETVIDDAGNVIIRRPATAGFEDRQGVLLQAHMDMVPQKADGKEFDFTTDPIPAFVNGDYIVTDGTTLGADNGIGIAMIMAILQSRSLQAGTLEALFTVDEESTMSGANGLKPDTLKSRLLINMDSEGEGIFTIGSAGGERANVGLAYSQALAPADMFSYVVKVQGLQGGHSGIDINKGLGHATRLLVRLLKGAEEPYGLRLASLSGGTASNAIPRDATAVIFLPAVQVDAFTVYVKDFEATIQSELAAVEPTLTVQLDAVQPPAQVMDLEFQHSLLAAIYGTPQGVARMSDTVSGLVETSNNLGIATIQDGQMQLVSYPRSSVDSELQDMEQMIISVWELAGYPVEITDWYAAWTPDPDSPILGLTKSAYQELFGVEPSVSAVHAGLECGAIGGIYPDMDMISIGPTLEKVHSPSERLYIPSVEKVMALLTEVLSRVPGNE
jgi:dipeptidase D